MPKRIHQPKPCVVHGCTNLTHTGGNICGTHQAWKNGRYGVRVPVERLHDVKIFRRHRGNIRKPLPPLCEIPECGRQPSQWSIWNGTPMGMCSMHSQRVYDNPGQLFNPRPLKARNGDGCLSNGYRVIPDGAGKRRAEHRVVMEGILGRKLTSDEHVHHRNGVKTDNRPENLVIISNREHKMLHWRLGWRLHETSIEGLTRVRSDIDALIAKLSA